MQLSLLLASNGPNFMDCRAASLCGVVTLETGLGGGKYQHDQPVVHGLWPQVGKYGSSSCTGPSHPAATRAPCSSTVRRPMPCVISLSAGSPKNLRPPLQFEMGHNIHGDSAAPTARSKEELDAFTTHDRAQVFLSAPSPPKLSRGLMLVPIIGSPAVACKWGCDDDELVWMGTIAHKHNLSQPTLYTSHQIAVSKST